MIKKKGTGIFNLALNNNDNLIFTSLFPVFKRGKPIGYIIFNKNLDKLTNDFYGINNYNLILLNMKQKLIAANKAMSVDKIDLNFFQEKKKGLYQTIIDGRSYTALFFPITNNMQTQIGNFYRTKR